MFECKVFAVDVLVVGGMRLLYYYWHNGVFSKVNIKAARFFSLLPKSEVRGVERRTFLCTCVPSTARHLLYNEKKVVYNSKNFRYGEAK